MTILTVLKNLELHFVTKIHTKLELFHKNLHYVLKVLYCNICINSQYHGQSYTGGILQLCYRPCTAQHTLSKIKYEKLYKHFISGNCYIGE